MNPEPYIAPIFNRFLDMVQRHAKYIISTTTYVEDLQIKKGLLNARRKDMNEKIEADERRSRRPTNEVAHWQTNVEGTLDKIENVLSVHESRSCICGICSDYKTGHRCDNLVKKVDELLTLGSLYLTAEMLDCDNSKIPISMPYVVPESLDVEALKCIEDDSSGSNVIGIWGPGGVGKTTLLKKVHNSCVETSVFKYVIWIVASSEQSTIVNIQDKIVENLSLRKNDDAQSQARIIHEYLRNKNFCLFIDDLWKAVDLDQVGVPNPYDMDQRGKKHKVVFTSRFKEVCGKMGAKKIIKVRCLDSTQSWCLFKEKVGEDILSDHRITEFAKGVAEECKGLPLALVTVGRAMSTKSQVEEWKIALNFMKTSQVHNVLGEDEQLLHILKLSYDYLTRDELKKCFLSISMWPEDFGIEKEDLIEFWIGLNIIDNFESIDDAYRSGHILIASLQATCLLEEDGIHDRNRPFVKMHDILRDLALWIASDCGKNKNKWMVKAGIHLHEAPSVQIKWSDAECISLLHNKIKELPSGIPKCPNLSTLALGSNELECDSKLNCFHNFISLTYLDLSKNRLSSFPESICDLFELKYLNMSSNQIEDLPLMLRNLKKLKYLNLNINRIRNVPRGVFSELKSLLVLNMYEATNLRYCPIIDVEGLKSIENQLLFAGVSVMFEENLTELMLLSKLCIKYLRIECFQNTSFHFMSRIRNPHFLRKLCITNRSNNDDGLMEIVLDKNQSSHVTLPLSLEYLGLTRLHNLRRIIWRDIAPEGLFVELRYIHITKCDSLEDITWVIHLPSLERFSLHGCRKMKIAINNDANQVDPQTFPSLKYLRLGIMELEKVSTHSLDFPQLEIMQILECPLLKTLPFEVNKIPKLRKIIGHREWWEKVEWEDDNSKSHFDQFLKVPS